MIGTYIIEPYTVVIHVMIPNIIGPYFCTYYRTIYCYVIWGYIIGLFLDNIVK